MLVACVGTMSQSFIKIDRDMNVVVSISRRMWSVSTGARCGRSPTISGMRQRAFRNRRHCSTQPWQFRNKQWQSSRHRCTTHACTSCSSLYRRCMTNTCASARKRFITVCTQIWVDVSVAQIAKGSILIAESTMYYSTLTLDISRFRTDSRTVRLGGAVVSHRFS